jgi:hypothetical protein
VPPSKQRTGWPTRGKKVAVTSKGKTVIGELRDTMPHRAKIKNGAGIDLNADFAKAFGVCATISAPGSQMGVGIGF